MALSLEDIIKQYPALGAYAVKKYIGEDDRRAKNYRQAWDLCESHGGVLQTAQDAAARRIISSLTGRTEDRSLLPQHTRTLAVHYKAEENWFIAFDDNPGRDNPAWVLSHAFGSPSQYSAGWTHPLDGKIFSILENAHGAGRILAHPSYEHSVGGTWLKSPLKEGQDQFETLAISTALFGDLAVALAQAHISLGREAIHYHLPRTTDLDELVGGAQVLIVPVVIGGAHAVSPVVHVEKSTTARDGVDTYLAATSPK